MHHQADTVLPVLPSACSMAVLPLVLPLALLLYLLGSSSSTPAPAPPLAAHLQHPPGADATAGVLAQQVPHGALDPATVGADVLLVSPPFAGSLSRADYDSEFGATLRGLPGGADECSFDRFSQPPHIASTKFTAAAFNPTPLHIGRLDMLQG